MKLLDEIKAIKSGTKELREFGLVMAGAAAFVAGVLFWKGKPAAAEWLAISAIFLVPALVFPRILAWPQKIWMTLAVCMGFVMSRVILTVLFFVVVTPIGFFIRLSGKRLLELAPDAKLGSYWTQRDNSKKTAASYERQF